MPATNKVRLWIPSHELERLQPLPLEDVVEAVRGKMHTAVLTEAGCLGQLYKTHLLVKVGHGTTPEGDVTCAWGYIRPQRNSLNSTGVLFTTLSSIEIVYHLKRRLFTNVTGVERIEVPSPDGFNLDLFVNDAHRLYVKGQYGLRSPVERDKHLLFYQPIKIPQKA